MNQSRHDSRITKTFDHTIWLAVAVVVLISVYPLLRYGGWWNVGNDTSNFTVAIRSVLDTGDLTPSNRPIYSNGYAFQALSVFLINLSGIDLAEWQVYGGILLIAWMVFPAWLLYREWMGASQGATLATIFLFIQPELLFGIMRGTHEKFSRGLILLCLYLLTYGFRSKHNSGRFSASVLAFYLVTFGLISFNSLFSSSFISAVLLALGMAWALAWRKNSIHSLAPNLTRMGYVVFTSLVLGYLYIFYVYDPAKQNLTTLNTITDRIAMLFLEVDPADTFNPYTGPLFRAWISPYIFLLLSLVNWLLLLGSSAIWVSQSARWLLTSQHPANNSELLQWAFYGAFALQLAFSILADISGALTGNLQHRLFPTVSMLGVPLVVRWLLSVFNIHRSTVLRLARMGLLAGVGLISLLSLMKATQEPVLSNNWQTYLPAEVRALDWAERTLEGNTVWTGFDRRLVEATEIRSGSAPRQIILDRLEVDLGTDNFLISDLIRLQVSRLGVDLPVAYDDLVTYDNGQVQIYHRRPRTPYQR